MWGLIWLIEFAMAWFIGAGVLSVVFYLVLGFYFSGTQITVLDLIQTACCSGAMMSFLLLIWIKITNMFDRILSSVIIKLSTPKR